MLLPAASRSGYVSGVLLGFGIQGAANGLVQIWRSQARRALLLQAGMASPRQPDHSARPPRRGRRTARPKVLMSPTLTPPTN